jgi:hypothetical protein
LFKITIQGISLWHFHVYMYYILNWFVLSIFLLSTLFPFLWWWCPQEPIIQLLNFPGGRMLDKECRLCLLAYTLIWAKSAFIFAHQIIAFLLKRKDIWDLIWRMFCSIQSKWGTSYQSHYLIPNRGSFYASFKMVSRAKEASFSFRDFYFFLWRP